jgi:hypothetical protein
MDKITIAQFLEFYKMYYDGCYGIYMRFGQSACNEFNFSGEKYADLFYEEDDKKSISMLALLIEDEKVVN